MVGLPHISALPGCREVTLAGDPSVEQPTLWEIEDSDLLQVGYAGTLTFEVRACPAASLPLWLGASPPAIRSLLHPNSGLTSTLGPPAEWHRPTGQPCAVAQAWRCLCVAAPPAAEPCAVCLQDMTVFLTKPCCSQIPDQLGSWFFLEVELDYQVMAGE